MIMANWTGVITNAGNDVLSEWVNEKTLNFDSAAAGQGTVATAGMLAQTALVNQKQTASIIGADRVSTGIRLKIRITAPKTAYTLNQYGVWASVTDGSSTMIALFQHEDGIPIPSATESPDFVYTFYALISTSNTGEWTVSIDTSTSVTLEEMNSAIATAVATKEGLIKDADAKNSIADADAVAVVDSADSSKTKRVLWSTIKSALGQIFVPLTRKINNKALSADITLTGDDIKTSATDETTVSSSLSNALNARAFKTIDVSTDLHTLDGGTYFAQGTVSAADNWPYDGWFMGFIVVFRDTPETNSHGGLLLFQEQISTIYHQGHYYHDWGPWKTIALATTPQEFDLPLVDGFVHYEPSTKSTYSKSQEGLVVVHFYCKKADGTDIVQNDTIAMLPEGFHPSANVHIPANVSFDGGSVYSQDVATAVADPTGRVWIAFPPAGCKAVTTTLVFYAAS